MFDQCFDIHRSGVALVHDKIGMFFRNYRPANLETLQATGLNQARGIIAGRIFKDRTAGWFIRRLAGVSFLQQGLNLLLTAQAVALAKL